MKGLQNYTANQTPIEIALGVDENGMTMVKKLFDFLGMSRNNYSRWYKTNITDNEFAEENIDYFPFLTNEECGGQASLDSKITARFAKKLSMLQKNDRGEEAREYFTRVEDYAVNTTIQLRELQNNPMKLLEIHYEALKQNENEIAEVNEKVEAVNKDLQDFKMDLPILGIEIDKITETVHRRGVNALGGKESNAYSDRSLQGKVYSDIYRELKRQFGVTTYKAIKRNQCDLAISVIDEYELPFVLKEQIKDCNAQMNMGVA